MLNRQPKKQLERCTMDFVRVRDMMIPLALYATVSEASSFYDTLLALKVAEAQLGQHHDTPKTILVFDNEGRRIAGQIDYWDLVRAIEPRYTSMGYPRQIIDKECNDCEFAGSLLRTYGLWKEPAQELCSKSAELTASKIMRPITAMELIEGRAPIEEAINSMLVRHLSLMIVIRGDEVVGVLRLTDVAKKILDRIKTCPVTFIHNSEEQSDNLAV
jgi:hypothetical protein